MEKDNYYICAITSIYELLLWEVPNYEALVVEVIFVF